MSATVTDAEVRDVMAELRLHPSCQACRLRLISMRRDRADLRRLVRMAARKEVQGFGAKLDKARAHLRVTVETSLLHLNEPHAPEPEPEPEPAPQPIVRLAKPDDRVKCPSCGGKAKEREPGRLGAHRSPAGQSCPRRLLSVDVGSVPVTLPEPPRRRLQAGPVRLPASGRYAIGRCHECDKPVTGERHYCGRCLAKRRL